MNDDGAGNLILISVSPKDYGKIYFQHHSFGIGLAENTDSNRRDTLALLANDFASFIFGLQVDE